MKHSNRDKLLEKWVKLRTSFFYFWAFLAVCSLWVIVNKTGIFKFDNDELTYLNLLLSVLTELQSIALLIYMTRMSATLTEIKEDQSEETEND